MEYTMQVNVSPHISVNMSMSTLTSCPLQNKTTRGNIKQINKQAYLLPCLKTLPPAHAIFGF